MTDDTPPIDPNRLALFGSCLAQCPHMPLDPLLAAIKAIFHNMILPVSIEAQAMDQYSISLLGPSYMTDPKLSTDYWAISLTPYEAQVFTPMGTGPEWEYANTMLKEDIAATNTENADKVTIHSVRLLKPLLDTQGNGMLSLILEEKPNQFATAVLS